MKYFNIALLAWKHVYRSPTRSVLTTIGVALGLFLFLVVESVQNGMQEATQSQQGDNVLVVYRENRFCPFTSRLPEHYAPTIRRIEGVETVVPVQVVVNNCGTSLDVVTFRGVHPDEFTAFSKDRIHVRAGSLEQWKKQGDGALLGHVLAQRRGLSVGDRFDAAGITCTVSGIIESAESQDKNVAFVHLGFLQQSSRVGLGVVTQFNVQIRDPEQMNSIAEEIDTTFASDQEPTHTRPEKAFVAQTASELMGLISSTRYIGLAAVIAVVALVANTVLLAIHGRVRDNAILQTLGYSSGSISWLVLCESIVLSVVGGGLGISSAVGVLHFGAYCMSAEGLSITFSPSGIIIAQAAALAVALGFCAGCYPAWKAGRRPIIESLRG